MDSEEDDVKNFIEDIKKIDKSLDYKAPILLVTTEWYVTTFEQQVANPIKLKILQNGKFCNNLIRLRSVSQPPGRVQVLGLGDLPIRT
jgi:hypothetical protein